MLMWSKSVIDSVFIGNGITAISLILIITVNSVFAIERGDLNFPGNDLIANTTNSGNQTGATSNFNATESGAEFRSSKILSRRKRYIAFPEGSSFSVYFFFLSNCSGCSM